jgi:hypothetical protein
VLYQALSRDLRQQYEFVQQVRKRYYQRETALLKPILHHGLEFTYVAGQDLEQVAYVLFCST